MNKPQLFFVFFLLVFSSLQAQVQYTLSFPISTGTDDAEEAVPTGVVSLSSSDLEMTMEATQQIIGLRFANIILPQGATVNSAFIQFTTDETDDVATSLLIEGELSSNASTFTNTNNDISNRPRTSSNVAWNDIPAWDMVGEAGPDQRSPDLTAIVQELVDQMDWAAGNAMAFIISGTGVRNAIAFNNGANMPARLIINYNVTDFPIEAFPVATDALWRYEDSGTDLGTDWINLNFDDSSWDFGQAEMGYGDGDENTILDFGGDENNKHITYYFRKKFSVADPSIYDLLTLSLQRDDGAVVYLNGEEVVRSNMPTGAIDFQTRASTALSEPAEDAFENFEIANTLQVGENILAIEIHQANPTSTDISFNLSLEGNVILPPAIQLIHNSPDPNLAFVDVYIDAFNLGNFVKTNGDTPIPFRAGTPYLTDLPPGTHTIAIAPFGQSDFMWSATEITLENNKRYIAMVSGVREPADFNTTINDASTIAFKIQVDEVPNNEEVDPNESLLLLFHGTPDLPNIRLIAVGAGDATGDFPEGLPYGFELLGGTVDALPYPIVQVTDNGSTVVYGEYKVDLTPYTEEVITLFASGFFAPDGNTGVDDPNFGLFIMPTAGGLAAQLPAPDPPQPGKVQIIHNSPDPDLASVDIWLNGQKVQEALSFLEATTFVDIPAGQNRIAISPHSTTDADTAWSATNVFVDADLNLTSFQTEGRTYTAVAYGVRNTTNFENAINTDVSFGVAFEEGREEAGSDDMVDLRFFHGATDVPGVDAILVGQFIPIINDMEYSQYSPIYVTLPEENFQMNLTPQDDNSTILFTYNLELMDRAGEALVILAAGVLNPAAGQPGFDLYTVDAAGVVSPLEKVIMNSTEELFNTYGIELLPNPVVDQLTIKSSTTLPQIRLLGSNGAVLQQFQKQNEQLTIPMQDLPQGIYLLEIQTPQGPRAVQILKQ